MWVIFGNIVNEFSLWEEFLGLVVEGGGNLKEVVGCVEIFIGFLWLINNWEFSLII